MEAFGVSFDDANIGYNLKHEIGVVVLFCNGDLGQVCVVNAKGNGSNGTRRARWEADIKLSHFSEAGNVGCIGRVGRPQTVTSHSGRTEDLLDYASTHCKTLVFNCQMRVRSQNVS